MFTTVAYTLYIIISIMITIFVSRTLSKNGEIYLIDGFDGNEALAKSVNHMLVVGFYLLNVGFVLLRIQTNAGIESVSKLLIYLSHNIGIVMFILGLMHFLNMFLIHRFRTAQIHRIKKNTESTNWAKKQNVTNNNGLET